MLQSIQDLLRLRRERGGAWLREEITSPMLVIFGPDLQGRAGFKTSTVSVEIAREAGLLASSVADDGMNAAGAFVAPVVKTSDSPWENRISVGRARNSDICISDGSLSKLHTHILSMEDGGFAVSDTGSKNGTRVNKELTTPGQPYPIKFGDLIHFGGVVAVFHSPDTFLRFLQLLDVTLERSESGAKVRKQRTSIRESKRM